MDSDEPITDIIAQEPLNVDRSGNRLYLSFSDTPPLFVKITEAVPDTLCYDGETRTAYRARKQSSTSGGKFVDSDDAVEFFNADDEPPQCPIFSYDDKPLGVGSVVRIYPGQRSNDPDGTVNYGLEWFCLAADDNRLAVLTAKTYVNVPYIDYVGYWVTDAPGGSGGIDFTLGEIVPGTIRNLRNNDWAVWRTFATAPTDPVPYFCVHRVWLTAGGEYVFDSDPPNLIFAKKTPPETYTDRTLTVFRGWLTVYNQDDQQLVRVIPAFGIDATTLPVVDAP